MDQGRRVNWCKVQRRTFGIYLLEGLLHFIYTVFFQKTISFSNGSLRFFICYDFIAPSYSKSQNVWHETPHSSLSIPGQAFCHFGCQHLSCVNGRRSLKKESQKKAAKTTEVLRHWLCQPLRWTTNDQWKKVKILLGTLIDTESIYMIHFILVFCLLIVHKLFSCSLHSGRACQGQH